MADFFRKTTGRSLLVGTALYILVSILIYWVFISFGVPFVEHQPLAEGQDATARFWALQSSAIWAFVEIGIIVWITKGYKKEKTVLEAPAKPTAKKELGWLLAYFAFVQLFGVLLGNLLGMHPLSFHLAGSIFGTHEHVALAEMFAWAAYNFVSYVVVPIVYFMGRKRYSLRQLNIISNQNVRRDIGVIAFILVLESIVQLSALSHEILTLSSTQALFGGFVAFLFNLFGTALPSTIFIFAILFPRYKQLIGNPVLLMAAGGATYMIAHLFESWMVFSSFGTTLASLGAMFLFYFMPGVVKSVLTYRTGNPWVHMWAYHAITPHVLMDAPEFAEQLKIK